MGKKRQRSRISAGELERLEAIKRLAIVAMFSDDLLMERLVLKGGNAIDLVYRVAPRASMDLDFSMPGEFDKTSLPEIKDRLANAIGRTFEESGYRVFDVEFVERPERVSPEVLNFWGGYVLEFKIIEAARFGQLEHDQGALRRNATVVAGNQKRTFRVDISKFEYCEAKEQMEFDEYMIYVYTPAMLVAEKLRAICQQMPEYKKIVPNPSPSARAKDFFDIYVVAEQFHVNLGTGENQALMKRAFGAKRVPLQLLGRIKDHREFHRAGFPAVEDTLKPGENLRGFDFYFDYAVRLVGCLAGR